MTAAEDPEAAEARLARVFEREIRPRLPALEAERAALGTAFRRELLGLSLAAAAVAALLLALGAGLAAAVVLALHAAGGALLYARRRRAWSAAALAAVEPALCALGDTRHGVCTHRAEGAPEALAAFEALGLVGAARHRILLHRIEGSRAGSRFAAQHATLARTRGRRGGAGRLFHGLLLEVSVPVPAPSPLVIVPAGDATTQVLAGVARPLVPPSFERVPLGDAGFDARFHVLAPVAASADAGRLRGYLTPGFRRALEEVDAADGGDGSGRPVLRAAFDGGRLLLALPRVDRSGWGPARRERLRPFLDPGGLFARGPLEARLRRMVADLALPHRIVERLAAS